jgi:hypothetical protein
MHVYIGSCGFSCEHYILPALGLIIEIVHIFFKMPRGKQFTEVEKGQIVAYHSERRGYKYIAKKMGRSMEGIRDFCKKMGPNGEVSPPRKREGRHESGNNKEDGSLHNVTEKRSRVPKK